MLRVASNMECSSSENLLHPTFYPIFIQTQTSKDRNKMKTQSKLFKKLE